MATEATNYAFSGTLAFEALTVAPSSELTVDWSGVTEDFAGGSLDPVRDIGSVSLTLWRLSAEELAAKLLHDALEAGDPVSPTMYLPQNGETSASLFDFLSAAGTTLLEEEILQYMDAEAYPPENHTYTVMAASGTVLWKGTRMIQAFRLDPSSTNTEVALDAESTQLSYEADLTSLVPVQVPAGATSVTIDWSALQVNAFGSNFYANVITDVMVARYSLDPGELEDQLLRLETIHQGLWRKDVTSGSSVDLATLTDDSGAAFPGIDDTSTWVVSLMCGNCTNPAPWYLTILEPCAD